MTIRAAVLFASHHPEPVSESVGKYMENTVPFPTSESSFI